MTPVIDLNNLVKELGTIFTIDDLNDYVNCMNGITWQKTKNTKKLYKS